jgi:DNA-binding FadR family transcriptional regulator
MAMARNSASLTDGLFAKLEERIRTGAMPPGSRFPAQLEISAAENVSRTVVREAVARLSAQGLTTSRQGSGVFVAATAQYRAFQVTRDRAYAAKVQGEHEAILAAIVRMDSTRAREAARHHMQESLSRHSQLSETTSLRPKVEGSGASDS